MSISFVKYTVKFAKMSGTKHVYTKQIGKEEFVIEPKEYFNAMINIRDKYRENYAYHFSTFSITEEQYKLL